jgi:ubiquinone/menaquinone biosynthesis C-methylase UbiE
MRFIVGKAEAIPLPDNSQDAVTGIFLFHELPPKIRRLVLSECALAQLHVAAHSRVFLSDG